MQVGAVVSECIEIECKKVSVQTVTASLCENCSRAFEDDAPDEPKNFKNRVDRMMKSNTFQAIIVLLVAVDLMLVTIELCATMDVAKLTSKDNQKRVICCIHIASCSILFLFILEVIVRLAINPKAMWTKWELFDIVVVLASITVDILHIFPSIITTAAEFIIVGRLVRVGRVVNGTFNTLRIRKGVKIQLLKKENAMLKKKIEDLKKSL